MIAQVLNREFVLTQVRGAQRGLEEELAMRDRRGAAGPLDRFSDKEVSEFVALLEASPDRPEGLEPAGPGDELLDPDEPRPQDDFAFVPSDPLLSIVQSVFEETVAERNPDALVEKELPDDRRSGARPVVTDTQLADVQLYRTRSGRRAWGCRVRKSIRWFEAPRSWVAAVESASSDSGGGGLLLGGVVAVPAVSACACGGGAAVAVARVQGTRDRGAPPRTGCSSPPDLSSAAG